MFVVNIDTSGLKGLEEFEETLKDVAESAARDLAAMTQAKAIELASERLNTRRQKFIDALSLHEEQGVMVLNLEVSARWIDDGMPAFDMLEGLLASPKAKRSADGSSYIVVPFDHSPGSGPTNTTPAQLDLVNVVKSEMKKRKIPWAKIERDNQGRPKIGKLHKFSIEDQPTKTGFGPGQGRGPVGDVRQGPNMRQRAGGGPGGGGIPFLRGVAVYQSAVEGGGAKRSVMTFRIASSKQQGEDIWKHPGLAPVNIFDSTWEWAMSEVEKTILPKIIADVMARL